MITFATLFLGLIVGVKTVDLAVGEDVASVEVLLSGRSVATLTQEPWSLEVDFGSELAPHELVAVARDAEEMEVGRVRQWINLPQPPVEVTVVLEGTDGQRVARLSWESLVGAEPRTITVAFDGRPLAVEDPRRIELPPYDERQLHFLRAELEFTDNVTSAAEFVFGGTYVDNVNTELSAVPVRSRRRKLPKRDTFGSLLAIGGQPLQVLAAERGAASVIVVADEAAAKALGRLDLRSRYSVELPLAVVAKKLWNHASLGHKHFIRFLWPVSRRQEGQQTDFDLFVNSQEYNVDDGGFFYLIFHAGRGPLRGPQRLADAVAVAGTFAAEQQRRRAVVLILGGPAPEDHSSAAPAQVRRFLSRLRIPFYAWSLSGRPPGDEWGEVRDVSSLVGLRRAADQLARDLDRQWIAWVDGVHLPQDVTLTPAAAAGGLQLVE